LPEFSNSCLIFFRKSSINLIGTGYGAHAIAGGLLAHEIGHNLGMHHDFDVTHGGTDCESCTATQNSESSTNACNNQGGFHLHLLDFPFIYQFYSKMTILVETTFKNETIHFQIILFCKVCYLEENCCFCFFYLLSNGISNDNIQSFELSF
jgi:hypothetical protein